MVAFGGTSIQEDKDKLRDGQYLVVGTPGRGLSLDINARSVKHAKSDRQFYFLS